HRLQGRAGRERSRQNAGRRQGIRRAGWGRDELLVQRLNMLQVSDSRRVSDTVTETSGRTSLHKGFLRISTETTCQMRYALLAAREATPDFRPWPQHEPPPKPLPTPPDGTPLRSGRRRRLAAAAAGAMAGMRAR